MYARTLKALKGSIKKWEDIVAGDGEDRGCSNCPLCKLFFHIDCHGCPVQWRTGKDCCESTPYEEYTNAETEEGALAAAKREVEFLKSLLPEGESETNATAIVAS